MNWLGVSGRALFGAVVGCVIAFFACGVLTRWEPAWIAGACAGLGAAAFAGDRSAMRGIVVATLAVWTAALAQARFAPPRAGADILEGLGRLHATMTIGRGASYLACAVLAFTLGRLAIRRHAPTRTAGT